MATIISIVSGKGGSGKSLLTAVIGRALAREGDRVLLVDMDIFVRGLTVLLFTFKRPERKAETATMSDLLGVFSEDSGTKEPVKMSKERYMIQRFFECDVLPAVSTINAPLDYDDRSLSDEDFCFKRIQNLLGSIDLDYDYVLLDNRAGMDSLVAAACRSANIVLSVAEDDLVGRQTNVNLVNFLQCKKRIRAIYTIINKGRNITTYAEVQDRMRQRGEFATLGIVPFDLDILGEFGSDRFWSMITETLYFRAVLDTWNTLAKTEQVRELSISKYRFPPRIFMQPSQGRFTLFERMLRVYSVLFLITAIMIWFAGRFRYGAYDLYDLTAVVSAFVGGIALLLSTSGLQSFLKGYHRADKRDDSNSK